MIAFHFESLASGRGQVPALRLISDLVQGAAMTKTMTMTALIIALTATGSAWAADMPVKAQAASPASIVPISAFFVGLGGSYNSTSFGTQEVYAVGTSSVFQNGVLVATGSAAGPGPVHLGTETKFAPSIQGGYFQKFSGSDWLWGFKFAYSNTAASSTANNVLLPQAGSSTTVPGGVTTPFTGMAVIRSYQTTLEHQIALTPFIGHSFEKSFVYLGAGPTLSRTRTNVNGLIGFANITGIPTDISGAPDFTGSGWAYGGSAIVGATYFLSQSWFLDFNYSYAMTAKQTFNYSSPFINPNGLQNSTIVGTLVGNSTGRFITQGVTATINKAF
jgi:opacity protein-like surface antigen